jgi:hypothetical protein
MEGASHDPDGHLEVVLAHWGNPDWISSHQVFSLEGGV